MRARGTPPAVALTFDDGPSQWTAEIAAALEAHDCRGTFFLLGSLIAGRPAVVAALAAADPERQSRSVLRAEIEVTADVIHAAAGVRPTLVRPPYCGAPGAVARAAGRE